MKSDIEMQIQGNCVLKIRQLTYHQVPIICAFGENNRTDRRAQWMNEATADIVVLSAQRGYFGLVLELKREGVRLYKKDGTLADFHFEKQNRFLEKCRLQNYYATFAVGEEEAMKIINWYFEEFKGVEI